MIAWTGPILKVMGRRREIVAVGPSPGKTPTRVPIKQPRKARKRLVG